jgi:hypothetical protein
MPLISLALADYELNHGLPAYALGERDHVPAEQACIWRAFAGAELIALQTRISAIFSTMDMHPAPDP